MPNNPDGTQSSMSRDLKPHMLSKKLMRKKRQMTTFKRRS